MGSGLGGLKNAFEDYSYVKEIFFLGSNKGKRVEAKMFYTPNGTQKSMQPKMFGFGLLVIDI